MPTRIRLSAVYLIVVSIIIISSLAAQAPSLIHYQGRVTDASGPVNGNYDVTFGIFDLMTGGSPLWNETHSGVLVTDGGFSVLLGTVTTLDPAVLDGPEKYLEIAFNGEVQSPRTRFTSVPYALRVASLKGAQLDTLTGGLIITPETLGDLGNAITILDTTGNVAITFTIDNVGNGFIDFYEPVDSKAGLAASTKKATLGREGFFMFGATETDTTTQIFPNGNISTIGQIAMGENSSGTVPWATVFGYTNSAEGDSSTISGGYNNTASGELSVIGGGSFNTTTILGHSSTIGGGESNTTANVYTTIGGGISNEVNGVYGTISGGLDNTSGAGHTTIGGGQGNITNGSSSTISGGDFNTTDWGHTTIGGGHLNHADAYRSTIAGGYRNYTGGSHSQIGGGGIDSTFGDYSTISGGYNNRTDSIYATVSGGYDNRALGYGATIGGGEIDTASGKYSTISGGFNNNADGYGSTVGGGYANEATGFYSTISGGLGATSSAVGSSVCGGDGKASGDYSTVIGGFGNYSQGLGAIAGGLNSRAKHDGSITFFANSGGYLTDSLRSGGVGQMVLGADGGLYITNSAGAAPYTTTRLINTSSGAYLTNSGTWTNASDENLKENFKSIDEEELLNKLMELDISEWNYIADNDSIKHIGPIAQQFYELFGVGSDDKTVSTIDPAGVALAAIKALAKKQQELNNLEQRLLKLEKLILEK